VVWGDAPGGAPAGGAGAGAEGGGGGGGPYALAIYTKSDCPLCDGLREKVEAAIAAAAWKPGKLTGATLEARDCDARAEWADKYRGVAPVLVVLEAGGERELPRAASPRIPVASLVKHLERYL